MREAVFEGRSDYTQAKNRGKRFTELQSQFILQSNPVIANII